MKLDDIFNADHCWNRIGVWGTTEPRCEKLAELTHCRNCEVYRRAGRAIFERELSRRYIEYWSNLYAESHTQDPEAYQSLIVFRLVGDWFALPSAVLSEIARYRGLHHIPHHKQRLIVGLVNLRGRISLCYSLGYLLGVDEQAGLTGFSQGALQIRRQLVVNFDEQQYVFMADEVAGVNRYPKSKFVDVPAEEKLFGSVKVTATLPLQDKQVYVLDAQSLYNVIQGAAGE